MKYYALIPILLLVGYFGFHTISLTTSKSNGFTCWASPTKAALDKCRKTQTCAGAGVYAWHPKKSVASKLAIKFCKKEFTDCVLDYCDTK